MQFPAYWSRHDFTANDRSGNPVTRCARGWSFTSQAEADEHARQRAERAVAKEVGEESEHYEYGHVPPREIVVDSIDLDGQTIGIVTRNRYGCRVLNTDRVMFADIDLPMVSEPMPRGFLARLRRKLAGPKFVRASDEQTLDYISTWHRQHPEMSLRIYRTFAGVRLLFTDRQYDPTEPAVPELLDSLGSDPLYLQLTQRQQTFRARLSPKPWRCGIHAPPAVSQIDNPDWADRMKVWAVSYEPRAREFATCRFVRHLGDAPRDHVIERIISIHDHHTLNDDRPLA